MGNESSSQAQQFGKKIVNNIPLNWSKDEKKSTITPREGQAAASIGSKLYIFGGVTSIEGVGDQESNELLVYDSDAMTWSKPDPGEIQPHQRSGATMSSVGNSLYLFGGLSQFVGWFNDFYTFDTANTMWRKIEAPNAPTCRDKVMSAALGDKVYIFGGFGPSQEEAISESSSVDDEYVDIEDSLQDVRSTQNGADFTWSNELFCFDTKAENWSKLQPNSDAPSPRAAHSLSAIVDANGKEWLYVFGGKDSKSRQNDLWKYDVDANKWSICSGLGCQPQPRSFHAAASVGKRLIIHGGRGIANQHFNDFNIFDSETNQWFQPEGNSGENQTTELFSPPQMGLHSLCVCGDHLLLFGGSSNLDPATGTCTKFNTDLFRVKVEDILSGGATVEEEKTEMPEKEATVQAMPAFLDLKPKEAETLVDH